jgi:PAS domain S-box-containing protein
MIRRQTSIQRKLTSAIMGTTVTVLLMTVIGFVSYELLTFNRWMENYVGTVGQIIANNSTAALQFDNPMDARATLSTLSIERHIVATALYDTNGALFARWPADAPPEEVPQRPEADGFHYEKGFLVFFLPVQNESRVGTLYLRSDLGARRERWGPYAIIVSIVLGASVLVALLLSRLLQRGISHPLLSLAETAKTISTRRDYSVRAIKFSDDEVGALTDAFNHMLTQLQERDTALRQNEERFRQLANAVPAFVWTCDAAGAAVYFNEPWYEYTGRTPVESLGLNWTQVIHRDDRDNAVRLWHAAVGAGQVYEAEARLRRFDGEYRWFLSRAHPTRDSQGNVVTWFGTSTDVEEKKRAEEKISQMNVSLEQRVQERTAQLEASNRELEAFSYSVAHDLRAPLRSIDGFNQAVLEDYGQQLPSDARQLFQRARQASQRMSQLIDDLLNLSRVTRSEMRHQKINLSNIATGIVAELQKGEPERRVNVRIQPGLTATGDDRLLRLVLENLLGNAFKFTRKKPVAEIEFGSLQQDGQRILFVRDNGAGFQMDYAGKLFGPFQRLHAVTEYPGTGIGLATVYRILLRHGCKIWTEAEVGKGATFFFTMPQ